MNECGLTVDATDYADRVLVSLDADLAGWVKRRAWEFERDPNETLDALVNHGNLDYEDALDLREE